MSKKISKKKRAMISLKNEVIRDAVKELEDNDFDNLIVNINYEFDEATPKIIQKLFDIPVGDTGDAIYPADFTYPIKSEADFYKQILRRSSYDYNSVKLMREVCQEYFEDKVLKTANGIQFLDDRIQLK